jgi:hypothetical protein
MRLPGYYCVPAAGKEGRLSCRAVARHSIALKQGIGIGALLCKRARLQQLKVLKKRIAI